MKKAAHQKHRTDAAGQFCAKRPSPPDQHGGNQTEDTANRQTKRTLGIRRTSTVHGLLLIMRRKTAAVHSACMVQPTHGWLNRNRSRTADVVVPDHEKWLSHKNHRQFS